MLMLLELEEWLKEEIENKTLYSPVFYYNCLSQLRKIKAAYACESLKEAGY